MTMIKESYERLMMDVTPFDAEDVITTSGIGPGGGDIEKTETYELIPGNM